MRRLPRLFAAVAFVAIVLTFVSARPAYAACAVFDVSGTKSVFIDLTPRLVVGHSYAVTYFLNGVLYVGPIVVYYIGLPIEVSIAGLNPRILVVDNNVDCGAGSPAVTFFNPGDGRINGEPGDRLVVYCNASATPPNGDVWVIDNGGLGHELAKLPLASLVPTVMKNLGVNGVLFAGSDASGNGYAALQGGPYGGTATGNWLKTFSCLAS